MPYRDSFIRLVFLMLLSIGMVALAGDPPNKLNYQGILSNSTGQPITGSVTVTFSLYDVLTGGTAKWSEQQSVTLANDGRFSVVLGSITPITPGLFTGTTYIGVKVGSDAEMPRQQLTSVAYALNANTATTAITAQKSLDTVQIPKGVIVMWSGSLATIPTGWALCDGELHDGTRTPNLKDRFVLSSGDSYGVGSTGGERVHSLTVSEIPGHTHSGTTGGQSASHTHNIPNYVAGPPGNGWNWAGPNSSMTNNSSRESNDHTHNFTTDNGTGGGAPHNNMPPYYALAYIMKL